MSIPRVGHTPIEWVFNADGSRPGYSCNPMTGCLNIKDGMCLGGGFPCYAYKQSHGRVHKQDLKGEFVGDGGYGEVKDSFFPRIHRLRFEALLNAPKNAGIFVCDRSDWAASYWPRWCQDYILDAARKRPDIRLYLLTKQPQELIKFSPFPDNCWVGVTICNERMLGTLENMRKIEAKVKFISFEPLLSSMDNWFIDGPLGQAFRDFGIKWVIIGAQTKPAKYPELAWVKEITEAADKAGAKVFHKNNLPMGFFDADGFPRRQGVPEI